MIPVGDDQYPLFKIHLLITNTLKSSTHCTQSSRILLARMIEWGISAAGNRDQRRPMGPCRSGRTLHFLWSPLEQL